MAKASASNNNNNVDEVGDEIHSNNKKVMDNDGNNNNTQQSMSRQRRRRIPLHSIGSGKLSVADLHRAKKSLMMKIDTLQQHPRTDQTLIVRVVSGRASLPPKVLLQNIVTVVSIVGKLILQRLVVCKMQWWPPPLSQIRVVT